MVYNLLPETEEILLKMGKQIKMARMRRNIPAEMMAEQTGISRSTLHKIETGSPSVSLGNYAAVLHRLNNMDSDFLLIAKDDEYGRKLQDISLMTRKRVNPDKMVINGKQNIT